MKADSVQTPVLIAVGASAGGVEAVLNLVAGLPGDLDAAVLVVIHIAPRAESVLPSILSRAGRLPAEHVIDGSAIKPGNIYVAPPDQHLTVEDGHLCLSRGPQVHGLRPAIDPLFESVAHVAGSRAIGVVLSGTLADGSIGLRTIKQAGGTTVVQDPATALYAEMPRNAMAIADPDYVTPLQKLPGLLTTLVKKTLALAPAERDVAPMDPLDPASEGPQPGVPSPFTCPTCHGVLWEEEQGDLLRYRCRVGHAWGEETLLTDQSNEVERALWTALRTVEEKLALMHRLGRQAAERGHGGVSRRFRDRADALAPHARVLRGLIDDLDRVPPTRVGEVDTA